MKFNKQQQLEQLKKEIGLPEISYDELGEYRICLSPTGRGVKESDLINAKDYVDSQLKYIEESFNNMDSNVEDVFQLPLEMEEIDNTLLSIVQKDLLGLNQPVELLSEKEPEQIPVEKYHYYDVSADGKNYTVIICNQIEIHFVQQSNFVKNHLTFIKERHRNMLTGLEVLISFYQFVNFTNTLAKPKNDLSQYENINARINSVFDGVKLDGFSEK